MSSQAAGGERARRSAEARRLLMRAAVDLIARHGSTGMTLAKVGTSAGYSRGLADYHFGSKAELIEQIFQAAARSQDRHVGPTVEGRQGLDAVLGGVRAYFDRAKASATMVRALYVLIGEAAVAESDVRTTVALRDADYRAHVQAQVAAGVEDGSVRADVDVEAAAAVVVALVRGAVVQWLVDPDAVDLGRLGAECAAAVHAHLEPRGRP